MAGAADDDLAQKQRRKAEICEQRFSINRKAVEQPGAAGARQIYLAAATTGVR
jgi:hypothetical protein